MSENHKTWASVAGVTALGAVLIGGGGYALFKLIMFLGRLLCVPERTDPEVFFAGMFAVMLGSAVGFVALCLSYIVGDEVARVVKSKAVQVIEDRRERRIKPNELRGALNTPRSKP